VRRIRLRALRRLQWLRHLWEKNGLGVGSRLGDLACRGGPDLADSDAMANEEKAFYANLAKESQLIEAAELRGRARPSLGAIVRPIWVCREYESDLLSLALAAEILPGCAGFMLCQ